MDRHQTQVPISDNPIVNPLCIILVKNGSKGDRLLFRYPYEHEPLELLKDRTHSQPFASTFTVHTPSGIQQSDSSGTTRSGKDSTKTSTSASPFNKPSHLRFKRTRTPSWKAASPSAPFNPYACKDTEDGIESDTFRFGFCDVSGRRSDILSELSDKDLSNLLSVNTELSERKFELKVNEVRFVGHPTLMNHPNNVRPLNSSVQTSIKIFHIVFCLHAMASHSIVKCFYDLSKRLGIGLRHEEYRCGYLSREMKAIISALDEACQEHSEDRDIDNNYFKHSLHDILSKSSLAQLMKAVYDDVCETGFLKRRINNWIQISFCLPQKIHVLPFRSPGQLVEPENIHRCLEAIRPYHSILLLVDREELVASFWVDSSCTIPRLLQVYSPLKSLQTMAADADLTLSHVVEIASHLVYWAMATVIYPICEANVYVVTPDAPITSSALEETFLNSFPGISLIQTLADFSLPMPLAERINPVLGGSYLQAQVVQLVCWLLQNRLLIQLHTYIHMLTYLTGDGRDREHSISNGQASPLLLESLEIRPYEHNEEDDVIETMSDSYPEPPRDDAIGVSPTTEREGSASAEQDVVDSARPQLLTQQSVEDLKDLNEAVRRAVGVIKTPISVQDIKMFSRLSKYFTGEFHFEEIMYRENVRRSQLLLLIDKFREVLITCEMEDADINFFKTERW